MPIEKAATLWFTGLSGAGKSTLANALAPRLQKLGKRVEILDGDEVRENLSKGLTFTRQDRDINIARIGWVAHLLTRNGVFVITAAISPYRETREKNRALIQNFVEVYVAAPVEICEARDVKGLYKKARIGEIKEFTGVSDPYEPPLSPEVTCHTQNETLQESTQKILDRLHTLGYL
jgi:adenylylsulfate kinase